jgi:hypothetical protein
MDGLGIEDPDAEFRRWLEEEESLRNRLDGSGT